LISLVDDKISTKALKSGASRDYGEKSSKKREQWIRFYFFIKETKE